MWLTLIKPILFAFFSKEMQLIITIASRYKSYKAMPDETKEEHKDRLRRMAINLVKEKYPEMRTAHIDILLGFIISAVIK